MNRSVHKDTCRIWDRGVCNCGPINAAPESRDAGGAAPSADSDGGAELPQVDANNSGLAMKLADGREVRARLSVDGGSVCFDLTATNAAHTKIALSFEAIESMRLLANRLAAAQECGEAVAPEAMPVTIFNALDEAAQTILGEETRNNVREWLRRAWHHNVCPAIEAAPPAPPAPLPGKEYRTGFDEAPSTFNQEDAAPADYPPLPKISPVDSIPYESIRMIPGYCDAFVYEYAREYGAACVDADRAQRSGVSADPLPQPRHDDGSPAPEDTIAKAKRILAAVDLYHEAPNQPNRSALRKTVLDQLDAAAAQSQPLVAPSAESHLANIGGAAPKDWRDGWNACREFLSYQVKKGEPS